MTVSTLFPWELTWADVDPSQHPFDPSDAHLIALPHLPSSPPADHAWMQSVTQAFVAQYGQWACLWCCSGSDLHNRWCCTKHSFSTPDKTALLIQRALVAWRQWIEKLAERFNTLAPTDDQELVAVFERAIVILVTDVVEFTMADDSWYGHCAQVLGWYLERWGIDGDRASEIVSVAIGGRFESWLAPESDLVNDVAQKIASEAAKALKKN
jgi:hypothetical protein